MNPILKKELTLGSRTIRMPIALMFYNGFLAFIAVLILFSACSYYYYGSGSMEYSALIGIFPTLAAVQMALICLIIPVITASSVAGEREKQTLDILLTTPITPRSIIFGKVWAALTNVFMFIISSVPSMAIAFLFGGLQWHYLAEFLVIILGISFFVGAVGIWCSSMYKRTVVSVIMTLVIELAFFVGTLILMGSIILIQNMIALRANTVYDGLGILPMILLANPLSGFVDFLVYAMNGNGLMKSIFLDSMSSTAVSGIVRAISPYWCVINLIVTIFLGLIFVGQAAKMIDPVCVHGKKKSRGSSARKKKSKRFRDLSGSEDKAV